MAKNKSVHIVTPEFRMSFPSLFKAKQNELSGKMEYSVTALFPKGTDLSKLSAAIMEVAKEAFPSMTIENGRLMLGRDEIRLPLRDGAEKVKIEDGREKMPAGFEKGAYFVTLKSETKPGVVDHNVQAIIDESQIYAGAFAIAAVNIKAYGGPGAKFKPGISMYLNNLQKTRDGDPIAGRSKPEQDFAPIAGAGTAATAQSLFG